MSLLHSTRAKRKIQVSTGQAASDQSLGRRWRN